MVYVPLRFRAYARTCQHTRDAATGTYCLCFYGVSIINHLIVRSMVLARDDLQPEPFTAGAGMGGLCRTAMKLYGKDPPDPPPDIGKRPSWPKTREGPAGKKRWAPAVTARGMPVVRGTPEYHMCLVHCVFRRETDPQATCPPGAGPGILYPNDTHNVPNSRLFCLASRVSRHASRVFRI